MVGLEVPITIKSLLDVGFLFGVKCGLYGCNSDSPKWGITHNSLNRYMGAIASPQIADSADNQLITNIILTLIYFVK